MTDDDINACADLVRRGDPDRFRAAMAAPVAARRVLFPLYAFNVEVARAPWVTGEEIIAEMRLQWWRDALSEIATGGTVRRHEVVTPLAQILDPASARALDQLVIARRWDIYRDPFEDEAHLRAHLDHTAGHMLRAGVCALGGEAAPWLADAGFAHGLAGWLRAVPALEDAGRIPLLDGRPEAVATLAREGLRRLDRARAAQSQLTKASRAALLVLWGTRSILKQAAANPGRVAHGSLGVSGFRDHLNLGSAAFLGRW